jgi:uncharacterized protein YeeX (DUF496 family)
VKANERFSDPYWLTQRGRAGGAVRAAACRQKMEGVGAGCVLTMRHKNKLREEAKDNRTNRKRNRQKVAPHRARANIENLQDYVKSKVKI